uniref:Uncharacterized protein n=1 Tax=Panagrolaimus sp. JU765 TaxID=591449 RepID=A0AC34RHL4_9BILA
MSLVSQTERAEDEDYYKVPSLKDLRKEYDETSKSGTSTSPTKSFIPKLPELPKDGYIPNPGPDHPINKPGPLPKEYDDFRMNDRMQLTPDQKEYLEKCSDVNKLFNEINKERFEEMAGDAESAKQYMFHPDNRDKGPYWHEPSNQPDP